MKYATIAAAVIAATAGVAHAVDYDEAVGGDLSGDRLNPDAFTLDLGANTFRMDTVNANDFVNGDIDYFSVTIPTGLQLDSIILNESSAPMGGDNRAFIGLAFGDIMPVDPMFPDPSQLTGFVITDTSQVGSDILFELNGFTPGPIVGEQTLTFWVQQTGQDLTTLDLTFNVAIPAPGAAALFGLAGLAATRRRR